MDSATYSGAKARSQPHTLPCAQACTKSATQRATHSGMEAATEDHSRRGFCPRGYSGLQIAILSALRSPHEVLAYWQIARLVREFHGLEATEGAVRGAIERLARYSLLVRERAARGQLKGNRYAFKNDPCPYIHPLPASMEPSTQAGAESGAQSAGNAAPSILEETDRKKNLSISSGESEARTALRLLEALTEEDIAFHWPMLARQGFGTDKIRQILGRLAQVNIGPEKVMQGLTHAEWDLAAGRMHDKSGNPISSPVSWVFKILAHQGYYPRPEGYRSPQEQAELDAAEELKRHTAAYEARQIAEADAWMARLTPGERSAILGPRNSPVQMPEEVLLRRHFREKVWPKLRDEEAL